jgi:hypothetical protein
MSLSLSAIRLRAGSERAFIFRIFEKVGNGRLQPRVHVERFATGDSIEEQRIADKKLSGIGSTVSVVVGIVDPKIFRIVCKLTFT